MFIISWKQAGFKSNVAFYDENKQCIKTNLIHDHSFTYALQEAVSNKNQYDMFPTGRFQPQDESPHVLLHAIFKSRASVCLFSAKPKSITWPDRTT